jgi:PAS domain S-box-containing protein
MTLIAIQDITTRKHAMEALRGSEERFRALAAATSYSIYRMAADWSEMRQLSGAGFLADTSEPIQDWLQKYIFPEDQPHVLRTIGEAIQTKSMFALEHRVRRADGTVGWTFSRAIPLFDGRGEVTEWFGAASDVSERRAHQEDLSRLAAIVDSADDAIISKDLNGIIRTWNRGATRIFGYTAEEAVGRSILMLIPEDLHYEEDHILAKLRVGERIDHYETVRKRKNGDTVEVAITVSPIRDESGVITGASKIARDISDRRRIERLLLQSEKLNATGRMAASIAHEINNPLESLINLIYLARLSTGSDSKTRGYLVTAEEELARVSHLARQTLGYYRDTTAPTHVRVHELIQNTLTVYNSRLTSAGISVDLRFNDPQPLVASKGELLQVFSNVIANAIDSMGQEGVLYIATRKVIGPKGEGLEVTIRDNGSGIKQENLPKVFEPFFTTKDERGTGIGLWVTKQLIESRGGDISVESSIEPQHSGTTVTIFIPFVLSATA